MTILNIVIPFIQFAKERSMLNDTGLSWGHYLWNSLPAEILSKQNQVQFKMHFKPSWINTATFIKFHLSASQI